jgi:AraC family transcriptional regulator, transcriptional activator of pobA
MGYKRQTLLFLFIMSAAIPIYALHNVLSLEDIKQGIFCVNTLYNGANIPANTPYRSDYYGIAICIEGKATLMADLQTYTIQQHSIIAIAPHIIKQWTQRSNNFSTITVFFKLDLIVSILKNTDFLNQFIYFSSNENHVLPIDKHTATEIEHAMQLLQNILQSNHAYKVEMAVHQLSILLFQYQALFQTANFKKAAIQTRSQQIELSFRNLVIKHFKQQHNVKFYADLLFITPKHLSEIIKSETGKTAGAIIDEAIMLEASVLLSGTQLSVNEIADMLGFKEQSAFGKFFKNLSGLSPKEYKNKL